jgi:predicted N-formylglutamate amidohydrolase
LRAVLPAGTGIKKTDGKGAVLAPHAAPALVEAPGRPHIDVEARLLFAQSPPERQAAHRRGWFPCRLSAAILALMQDASGCTAELLVAPSLTESYEILPGRCDAGLVLLCDHAVNALPEGYGTLGLPEGELKRHIAYDIGAYAVTRGVAQALGVPAISTRFSRLLIDPNRGLDDPTLIMRLSDGAVVPGNRHITQEERDKRVAAYYEPYHLAIDDLIEQCMAAGVPPVLLSIHSFTETWKGSARPWHAAILWDRDFRFAVPLLKALRAEQGVVVGENEPYDGKLAGDCMWQHGTRRGLAHTILEVRQDLIRDVAGQTEWVQRIATATADILGRADLRDSLHAVQYFGSHTDTVGGVAYPAHGTVREQT